MKTILVPIDFSVYAQQSIKASVHLAAATGARIIFLHTVFTETNWESLPLSKQMENPDTFKKDLEAKKKMKVLMNSALIKNIRASSLITYGLPAEEIAFQADKLNVDLILMGSHGNEGSEKYFIGSTIQKVLRESSQPVLMTKKDFKPSKRMKVAIASDLDSENHKAFSKIKKLITDLHATAYLVFINRPTDFLDTRTIHKMMDAFTKQYPKMKFQKVIYNHTEVAEGILQFAEDNHMNWVALLTRNRKGKPKYLIGNTETIVFRSSKPVLSMNILPEAYPVD